MDLTAKAKFAVFDFVQREICMRPKTYKGIFLPHFGRSQYITEDFYFEFGKMIKRSFIMRDITHRDVPKHMTSAHDNSSICIIWHGCKLVVYCLVTSYSYILNKLYDM